MTRPVSYEDPGDRFASPAYDDWLEKATSFQAAEAVAKALIDSSEDILERLARRMANIFMASISTDELAAAAVAVGFCKPFEEDNRD